MEDLGLIAELFRTSSTLERSAASLEKLASGQDIGHVEAEALEWSGRFLFAVDWNTQQHPSKPIVGGLALQATSVRPTFYSCLFRIVPRLQEAGMRDEREIILFLSDLYKNLISHGAPSKRHKRLTADQFMLGALLLHEIAESILVQINNNGLPRPTATLKDEWKPTANELTPVLEI
jgi:hypothetical protein